MAGIQFVKMPYLTFSKQASAPPTPAADDFVIFFDDADGHWKKKDEAGVITDLEAGVANFIDLGDVPADYTGHASKALTVKATEDGIEFTTISGGRALIAEVTPRGVSTITVSSTIAGTYKRLIIEYALRSTDAAANVGGYLYFNNDTTAANYRQTMVGGYAGSTVFASGSDTPTFCEITGAGGPANSFTIGTIEVIQYANTSFRKHALCQGSHRRDDAGAVLLVNENNTIEWENTAAITRIDIALVAGNFVAGSVIRLYGEL